MRCSVSCVALQAKTPKRKPPNPFALRLGGPGRLASLGTRARATVGGRSAVVLAGPGAGSAHGCERVDAVRRYYSKGRFRGVEDHIYQTVTLCVHRHVLTYKDASPSALAREALGPGLAPLWRGAGPGGGGRSGWRRSAGDCMRRNCRCWGSLRSRSLLSLLSLWGRGKTADCGLQSEQNRYRYKESKTAEELPQRGSAGRPARGRTQLFVLLILSGSIHVNVQFHHPRRAASQ